MKILVQWARSAASCWEELDSADWPGLPTKGKPLGRNPDGKAGWINALNVQGVIFSGDAIAVEPIVGDGVRVTQINDDPSQWNDARHARVVDILPLGFDAAMNGAINTRMHQTVFIDPSLSSKARPLARTAYRAWDQFVSPSAPLLRHGIQMPDRLYDAHVEAQTVRGWREWIKGLPQSELANGQVRPQRPLGRYVVPKGTKTYYHVLSPIPIGAVSATNENALNTTTGTTQNQDSGNIGATGKLEWATATPSGEPDNAVWPTGEYRAQLDVVVVHTDVEFGLLTLDTVAAGFCRWDSTLATLLEQVEQSQAAFTLSGLHLASVTTPWSAGAIGDRFGYVLNARRFAGHGIARMTLQLGEADDYTDGPWTAGVAGNAPFFGANF